MLTVASARMRGSTAAALRGEDSCGDVEECAAYDHAPVMRLAEPDLRGLKSEVCACGQPEVCDAEPANRREREEDPVTPQTDSLRHDLFGFLHGQPPSTSG